MITQRRKGRASNEDQLLIKIMGSSLLLELLRCGRVEWKSQSNSEGHSPIRSGTWTEYELG